MGRLETARRLARFAFAPTSFCGSIAWILGFPAWVSLAMAVVATGVLVRTFVALRA